MRILTIILPHLVWVLFFFNYFWFRRWKFTSAATLFSELSGRHWDAVHSNQSQPLIHLCWLTSLWPSKSCASARVQRRPCCILISFLCLTLLPASRLSLRRIRRRWPRSRQSTARRPSHYANRPAPVAASRCHYQNSFIWLTIRKQIQWNYKMIK